MNGLGAFGAIEDEHPQELFDELRPGTSALSPGRRALGGGSLEEEANEEEHTSNAKSLQELHTEGRSFGFVCDDWKDQKKEHVACSKACTGSSLNSRARSK